MLRQITSIALLTSRLINRFQISGTVVKIEALPGKDWISLPITPGTFSFSEKSRREGGNLSYEQELKCNLRAGDPVPPLATLEAAHIIVRIGYNTGELEVIGCPDFPARIATDLDVKQSSTYSLKFTCSTIYRTFKLYIEPTQE